MDSPEQEKHDSFPLWVKIILTAVILALFGGGLWYFRAQQALQRHAVEENLWSIAQLKAREISKWREERITDALVLMERRALVLSIERFLSEGADQDAAETTRRLRTLKERYHFEDIFLIDSEKNIRLSMGENAILQHKGYSEAFDAAVAGHGPVWGHIHADTEHISPHIGLVIPFYTEETESKPVGGLVLVSDASQFLYPLIQSWPTASETAETLLIQRDGDDVLFLNELRHQENTALKLRIPLSQKDLPAAMAVSGTVGVVEGRDYRGVKVLAAILPVEGSPWFMVAKIDSAEAFAVWRFRSVMILVLLSGAVGLVVLAWILVAQSRQKVHYRKLYRSESKLSQALKQYEVTLRAIGDGVISTDVNGCVEFMNPVAEDLTGWPLAAARGKKISEVFITVDEKTGLPCEDLVGEVILKNQVKTLAPGTLLLSKDDGQEIPVADSVSPIRNQHGGPVGVVLVFKDERVSRQLHKDLAEARKMEAVGRLAGGMAHDYNNMLNIIIGNAELGVELMPPENPMYGNFQEIITAAKRSAVITRKLLAFARRQMVAARVVALNEELAGMLDKLRQVLGDTTLLDWRPGNELWPVKIDPAQLHQVISNLCDNCREAIDGKGEVRLETNNTCFDEAFCSEHPGSVPGDFVMVAVTDNGRGMDRETLNNVFEPFFTTKPFGESAGMGLAVAYGIVKQNNGFFDVESRLGQGASFRFFLPRQVEEKAEG